MGCGRAAIAPRIVPARPWGGLIEGRRVGIELPSREHREPFRLERLLIGSQRLVSHRQMI